LPHDEEGKRWLQDSTAGVLNISKKSKVGDTVNNTTRSFLIDVIIRNQDIKKIK